MLQSLSTEGKRLRPLIMTLCAEIVGGNYLDTKDIFIALELIHNATLVHDDIIDDDLYRRGTPSIHVDHGIKKAILTGDALLSVGLMYAARTENPNVVNWLSETALKMVQGIAIQNEKKRKIMSIEEYLHMNYLKSGSLFEAASALGGEACHSNFQTVKKLGEFGKFFGNAYQIRDDIIDAFNLNGYDKAPKNDLLNGDASLLLLYALESETIRDEDSERLLKVYMGNSQDIRLAEISRIYVETKALHKSIEKMKEFAIKASNILNNFENGVAKENLLDILNQYGLSLPSTLFNIYS